MELKNFKVEFTDKISEDGLSLQETNQLLKVHKEILEVVVTGNNFQFALDSLCKAAEGIFPEALASIILYNEDKTALIVRSAPNIPDEAIEQLSTLLPGEGVGSCAAAIYSGESQFVSNTLDDERWVKVRSFAHQFEINACWSMPIKTREGEVIGSFALSSAEIGKPNYFHENLLRTASYLASLVLLREKEEKELQSAAYQDIVTGLPNRSFFNRRMDQALSRAQRNESTPALFFIDLDNFKSINDELGHDVGDSVLHDVATKMQSCIRKDDTLARLGGDEFVLLVEEFFDLEELETIAKKILKTIQQNLRLEGKEFEIASSIGISLYPDSGLTGKELIKSADQAMYIAKNSKTDKFHFSKI